MKLQNKKINYKEFVFIDTDVFINAITGNSVKEILTSIKNRMDNNELYLIVPELIKAEINNVFEIWQIQFFEKVDNNLKTKNILGIEEEDVGSNIKNQKPKNKKDKLLNADKINGVIDEDRNKLISNIKVFYNNIFKEINILYKHKNAKLLLLTDKMIIRGMKRSLLKMAPFTNKTTEKARTNDADCIAFESIITFINSTEVKKEDKLTMCVKDKDYTSDGKNLYKEIKGSLKKIKNIEICSDLNDFLKTETKNNTLNNKNEQVEPSLAIPSEEMGPEIDSSST